MNQGGQSRLTCGIVVVAIQQKIKSRKISLQYRFTAPMQLIKSCVMLNLSSSENLR
jgi:hypothetical protein